MTVDQIEDLAFQEAPLPDNLPFPEQLLFLKLRYLYAYAKISHLPPEQGKKEKNIILGSFQTDRFMNGQLEACVRLWKNVEALTSVIAKADFYNIPQIKDLCNRIYQSKIGGDIYG